MWIFPIMHTYMHALTYSNGNLTSLVMPTAMISGSFGGIWLVKLQFVSLNDLFSFRQRLAELFGMYETVPYDPNLGRIAKVFCNKYAPTKPICALLFFMYAGWDPKQLDKVTPHRTVSKLLVLCLELTRKLGDSTAVYSVNQFIYMYKYWLLMYGCRDGGFGGGGRRGSRPSWQNLGGAKPYLCPSFWHILQAG